PKFGVLQALQGHPGRDEIIKEYPKLTVREARTIMRDYRLAQEQDQDQDKEQEQAEGQDQEKGKDQNQEEDWHVEAMRRALGEVTEFAGRPHAISGHLSKQNITPIVLRAAVGDVDVILTTWRRGARAVITLAVGVKSFLKPPM